MAGTGIAQRHASTLFLLLVGCGLGVVVACQGVMVWDGSYLFFQTLDAQTPFIPHHRLIVLPAEALVLLGSRFTDDLRILGGLFGLGYALMVWGILAAAVGLLRGQSERLVWVALAMGLGTLPGQFALYIEAVIVVQLFWLGVAGLWARRGWVALVVGVGMVFTHPFAVLLLPLLAGVAWVEKRQGWAAVLLGASAFAAGRFWLLHTDYEGGRLSLAMLHADYLTGVAGYPLVGLLLVYAGGVGLLKKPRWGFVLLVAAGVVWVAWGRDHRLWTGGFAYRSWAVVATLPFLAAGMYQSLTRAPAPPRWTLPLVGVIFAAVLSAQSWAWWGLNERLDAELAAMPTPCQAHEDTAWLLYTPLDHWSITVYALIVQGRSPQKVILYAPDCAAWQFETGMPITYWEFRRWGGGWFALAPP